MSQGHLYFKVLQWIRRSKCFSSQNRVQWILRSQ